MLHFEMHGNLSGLQVGREIISLEVIINMLRKINIESEHNLFVSFAVCNAFFLYPEIDIFKPAPFFAFIGSVNTVNFETIENGFQEFYEELLSSFDAAQALKKLNNNIKFEHEEFYFRYAQSFFEEIWIGYNNDWDNLETRHKKIQDLMIQALHRPSIRHSYSLPSLRYTLENLMNQEGRGRIKDDMLKYFLMEGPKATYIENIQ